MTHAAMSTGQVAAMHAVSARDAHAAIACERITKRFGSRIAVREVSLRLEPGTVTGLVGLNGAGKSTLLRMMMGLTAATSGRVLLRGVDVAREPIEARKGVAFVPDKPNAFPWMRVREVMELCATLQPSWDIETARRLVQQYRLDGTQRVSKLSKGQGAKLSLLLALAQQPDVLVLDEPTDGLDPIARDEFLEEVIRAVGERERLTILISSHALDELERIVDHVALMHDGGIVLHQDAEQLLKRTKRIAAVLDDGVKFEPPGCILTRREGRGVTWTLQDCDERVVATIAQTPGVRDVQSHDMRLADVFKDVVRGMQEREGAR
ncbi:MAG TPA: ABC transporter ATP-binding protein [Phycisphaerales bacterium]|nr:ABC transporter ATP-binding protein [Phycisphaerales bacterium]